MEIMTISDIDKKCETMTISDIDKKREKKIRDTIKLFQTEELQSRYMCSYNILIQSRYGQMLVNSDNRLDPNILKTIQYYEKEINKIMNKDCEWVKIYLNRSYMTSEVQKLQQDSDLKFCTIFCMDHITFKTCDLDDYEQGDCYSFFAFD